MPDCTHDMRSRLNLHTLAVNILRPDPPVDKPAVIADLIAAMFNGLDDMQVLISLNLAQHDIPNFQLCRIDRDDSAELPRLDASNNGVTVGTKLNHLTGAQFLNVVRSPAHQLQVPILAREYASRNCGDSEK